MTFEIQVDCKRGGVSTGKVCVEICSNSEYIIMLLKLVHHHMTSQFCILLESGVSRELTENA